MARNYKILGQEAVAATTQVDLYTVPSNTEAVISTLSVCNRAGSGATYRIAIIKSGETLENKHYLIFDSAVPGNDTAVLTLGLTMSSGDKIGVYSSTANVTFSVYGSEIS
jgi:hypothetical protein